MENIENIFDRTKLLLGENAMQRLKNSTVAIFGVGGVGGFVAESLARSGIGNFVLVDNDTVSFSNINRQIIATIQTVGKNKVEVMKERILSINPNATIIAKKCFFLPQNSSEFDFNLYDYVIDAVDTVSAKIEIIVQAKKCNKMVISSMGAGNKLDPTKFSIADISKTSVCPLARVMRNELKKRKITGVKCVFSTEEVKVLKKIEKDTKTNKVIPGSVSFVPSVAGLIIASEVIKDLICDI